MDSFDAMKILMAEQQIIQSAQYAIDELRKHREVVEIRSLVDALDALAQLDDDLTS